LDKSESVSQAPAEPAGPKSVGSWFTSNLVPILVVVAAVGFVIWKELEIWPLVLMALGLGLVIFIHELGHFLAAKFCDVHVETFSIGFGKALPFCQFRWGETMYKIGWIPLGGYVKMVGEGENADTEEAEEDPRSFKNKSVWQRMVIISAGVVMNLILGAICFIVAYSHGVEETPAVIGAVGVGSPAWEGDLRIGDQIISLDGYPDPTFDDIKPKVMSQAKGEAVVFVIRDPSGAVRTEMIVPRRNPDDLYPMVGINPIEQLTLAKGRRASQRPAKKGSPADAAEAADGSKLQGGDKVIAATNPQNPAEVTPVQDIRDFLHRQFLLRGRPMTVRVDRGGTTHDFALNPAYTSVLPGVRFQMGRIAALRAHGPASRAVLVGPAGESPSLQTAKPDEDASGDKIVAVDVQTPEGTLRFVDELSASKDSAVKEVLTDPVRLGYDLEKWAETATDLRVRLTVLRSPAPPAKAGRRVTFDLTWDPNLVFNGEFVSGPSSPLAISGLGLAYYVDATVDSAAAGAPLQKGDVIKEVRFRETNDKGETEKGKWLPLKQHQGAYVHSAVQLVSNKEIDLKVERGGAEQEVTVTFVADNLTGTGDPWPAVDRGLVFPYETRIQKADNIGDALGLGVHRTKRTVQVIYQTLYATIFRQISPKTMSGPLSIANASYKIALFDKWQFILFIGLISINLAIVNFLPIPLLDGGHMVFLIYEKVRGKPAPERIQAIALYLGLAFILLLMAFVLFLDVRRLWF
jgi:regulator of sigma E protease